MIRRALGAVGLGLGLTLSGCASDGRATPEADRDMARVGAAGSEAAHRASRPRVDLQVREGVERALKEVGQAGALSLAVGARTGVGGSGNAGDASREADAKAQQRDAQLAALSERLPQDVSAEVRAQVLDFYSARDWSPAWVTSTDGHKRAQTLLQTACEAAAEGLDVGAWKLDDAKARLASVQSAHGPEAVPAAVEAELALTAAFLRVVDDLRHGQVDPERVRWLITAESESKSSGDDAHALLGELVEKDVTKPKTVLETVRPEHPQYARLLEAKRALEAVKAKGGWPQVSTGKMLKPGDEDPRVTELRKRLAASGELGEGADLESPLFDDALAEALKRFQRNRGLEEDGALGTATLTALREPVEKQLERIAVNLERLRWLPFGIEGRHLVVNLPDYTLEARDGDKTLFTSPVVVGVDDWQTPIMVSNIVRLEVNPRWTVPPRMTREKIFPKYQAAPDELPQSMRIIDRETGDEVDPAEVDWESAEPGQYRFVQRSGPNNPMGGVKLAMDNRFMIFLHGTNEPQAFEQTRRALSHGCVRVKALDEVSRFALPDDEHARYDEARESGRETTLKLEEPLPVYFVYFTAWVDEEGTLQQRPDIYGRDARTAQAMGERAGSPLACR